ncbi:MAG: metallophosphoesterase family protein [Pseudomonadota bacterium]
MLNARSLMDAIHPGGRKAHIPAGTRVYAIGDVHGCADLLDRLLDFIDVDSADLAPGARTIITLGDYVDRGPDSPGVLDRLIARQKTDPSLICLKGNHEDELLGFLADPDEHVHWLDWGGEETLSNYGVRVSAAREPRDLARELGAVLPEAHRQFLHGLSVRKVIGDYLFVHAGIKPGVPLDEQTERDQMWVRGEFHSAPTDQRPDKIVIHGHQSAKKVVDKGWRICVDTGAVWNGVLTAIVLEGNKKRFLQASAD